jgi:hypothetical protein
VVRYMYNLSTWEAEASASQVWGQTWAAQWGLGSITQNNSDVSPLSVLTT